MTQLDIPTAAARLADLIAAAAAGEDVVIADAAGRPVARLVAAAPASPAVVRPPEWSNTELSAARARGFGAFAGRVWMSDDCFDPMTDEELKEWGLA